MKGKLLERKYRKLLNFCYLRLDPLGSGNNRIKMVRRVNSLISDSNIHKLETMTQSHVVHRIVLLLSCLAKYKNMITTYGCCPQRALRELWAASSSIRLKYENVLHMKKKYKCDYLVGSIPYILLYCICWAVNMAWLSMMQLNRKRTEFICGSKYYLYSNAAPAVFVVWFS